MKLPVLTVLLLSHGVVVRENVAAPLRPRQKPQRRSNVTPRLPCQRRISMPATTRFVGAPRCSSLSGMLYWSRSAPENGSFGITNARPHSDRIHLASPPK